jgi:predicted  nucleic acid-binding Zn-ribbon protein
LAADEIAKLKAEGKVVLAAGIQKLDKTLVDLETQLKGLNPQTEVGKGLLAIVEAGLKKVETALEAEIKKLSGGFYADDELEKLKAQLEDELKKMGSTSPVIDDIRAKIEAELKKMAGGFF